MKKEKELKLWNGRGIVCRNHKDDRWKSDNHNVRHSAHAFVAAYSRADARRIIESYTGCPVPDSEIVQYWSAGHWGNTMNGIQPERGLWIAFDGHSNPIKVA